MYVPPVYRAADPAWTRQLVRSFPLALLVSPGGTDLQATHLPVIPMPGSSSAEGGGDTGLVGCTLAGHMNRRNPHWAVLQDGPDGHLLIIQGPSAYITPTIYQQTPAAPTWDYVALHLRGRVVPVSAGAETLRIVQETVVNYERDHGTGWDPSGSVDYFKSIVAGVGAFTFEITGAEAMVKLSQDKPAELRDTIADHLGRDRAPGAGVAAAMRTLGLAGPCPGMAHE
ncbi:FMN-binding negative transcriptional regulator [Kribbella sp. NPDC051620]|uniref:FMN-binding negative transcriptional regulator n=1 Tax=Kribbella sp. NPDC051620 TaxID=3364120 RepID=UPI00379BB47F